MIVRESFLFLLITAETKTMLHGEYVLLHLKSGKAARVYFFKNGNSCVIPQTIRRINLYLFI